MDEATLKTIAAQLRQPTGTDGIETGERMNIGNHQINLDTITALDLQPNDQILEIGMGNGHFVKEILDKDATISYTGCDFSEDMINEALRRNQTYIESGRAQFIHTNAESIPVENNSFDKIFTINTLYFWEDVAATLREFQRLLKTNGKLLVAIRPKKQMIHYPFVKYGFNLFSREEVENLLEENNFKVIQSLENEESTQERFGEKMLMENLIVIAKKKEHEI